MCHRLNEKQSGKKQKNLEKIKRKKETKNQKANNDCYMSCQAFIPCKNSHAWWSPSHATLFLIIQSFVHLELLFVRSHNAQKP